MLRNPLDQTLLDALRHFHVEALMSVIESEAMECAHLIADDDCSAADDIRLGGSPDLPEDVDWPAGVHDIGEQSKLANHVLQLDFGKILNLPASHLPQSGYLWLFLTSFSSTNIQVGGVFRPHSSKLHPRKLPPHANFVLGRTFGSMRLRMVPGISIPFAHLAIREAIERHADFAGQGWQDIDQALTPAGSIGQIGGFAYSADGLDLRRDIVLRRAGEVQFLGIDLYETMEELDESAKYVPPFVQTAEHSAIWRQSYDRSRAQMTYVGRYREEIEQLRLLVRLTPYRAIGFDLYYPLWIYIRNEDLLRQKFDRLIAILAH